MFVKVDRKSKKILKNLCQYYKVDIKPRQLLKYAAFQELAKKSLDWAQDTLDLLKNDPKWNTDEDIREMVQMKIEGHYIDAQYLGEQVFPE